jgi:multiple sugar transport system ATP-binding protein
MADVRLDHVWKRFDDDTVAVRDVSFDLKDGSFLVIVGPSGCGKTTTLRMIAGLETASEGDIYIDGRLVNDVHPKDRDIAMVFQNYALYPHMTVRQNLEFALKMRKIPKQERDRQVAQTARMLELSNLLDRKPKQLSGGQRQRVALGRAIVRQPKVFLFDEPLSNLDAKLRTQTRAELQRLHHELKATSIYVTHDQVEAMTMADLIVVMNEGTIQQVDTPMRLYNNPVNRFVAGFIGSIGMNFFSGHIDRRERGALFVEEGDAGVSIPTSDSLPDDIQRVSTLGVRPEHFAVTDSSDPNGFDVQVEVVETLGSHTLVHFRSGDGLSVASVDPESRPQFGDRLRIKVRPGKAHFFDREERAVATGSKASVAA